MLDTVPPDRLLARADLCARWAGLALGAVVAQALATMDSEDMSMPFVSAVTAFGLCAVGGVLLGDSLTPAPQEAVRTAGLAPRRVRDHVPPRMAPLLVFQTACLAVLLAIGVAVADPDGAGRTGRALAVTCAVGFTRHLGPWPGLYYATPVLVSLTLGSTACFWALRRIAHRPGENQQRHDRSWAITAAWGLLVSSQLLLVLGMIGRVLFYSKCAGMLGNITALVIYPLGLLSLFTVGWCLLTIVVPRAVDHE
ncbi:hypothetical protein [Streptomyces aurantiogriseus]|uniref:Uncharacterized protein n=1 Tax=Streptomyces aurantiogriseus TaxID=66870 RepID=A0A918FNX3_9ACTN|nr:hypothetical protein [Streptomyces aurantiogriseus]GGR62145.1 hypothetical protein GCM10010251_93620 [Streptomyces aurantiogriseus]